MASHRLLPVITILLFFVAPGAAIPQSTQVRTTLTVMVPNENAELTIEGQAIPGTGSSRTYETPPLPTGSSQRYNVTITWQPNGYTTMTRHKAVTFKAGENVTLDLTAHDPADKVRVQFVPTPTDIAQEMVKLAGVTANDVVFEPGCGDARITMAAVRAGAKKGVCIDIDPKLVEEARVRVKEAGLADRIEVRLGDALQIPDLSTATVVLLYMGDHFNLLMRPNLWKQLKTGSRVVSHRFQMGDWPPEKTVMVQSEDGLDYELHRWIVTDEVKRKSR